MMHITSHILDTSRGMPAQGITVVLYVQQQNAWMETGRGVTDSDGRVANLLPINQAAESGIYKITFGTKAYFDQFSIASLYPVVEIIFEAAIHGRYHIPLLLNPFGYTTYRGS